MSLACNQSELQGRREYAIRMSLKNSDRTTLYYLEGGNPMEKPYAREIREIDDTVFDLLVHDDRADQALEDIQAEQNPNHAQLFCLIDPYTRLIMPYRLSYEEGEMKPEH
jgi:hypothetical protein